MTHLASLDLYEFYHILKFNPIELKKVIKHFLMVCQMIVNKKYKYIYIYAAAAKSLQSCPTLWDPIDGSPPDSPVPGILQARTLEWVAISFSNA